MANDGTLDALTMLFVMPVSAVIAGGMLNRPGFTNVLNDAEGSESDCAASSIIRLFSLLKPVVSKSKTIIVGNSVESLEMAGFFVVAGSTAGADFALCTVGDELFVGDAFARPPRVEMTVVEFVLDVCELGGDHARGAAVSAGGPRNTAGSAADTLRSNNRRRSASSFEYIIESRTMCANIGDEWHASSSRSDAVRKL